MSQNSLQILFLALAVVGLVFGFGVVIISRRRAQAVRPAVADPPVVETPTAVEEPAVAAPVVESPAVPEPSVVAEQRSVRDRLAKARANFSGAMTSVLSRGAIEQAAWDDLEEALLLADVGVHVSRGLLDDLKAKVAGKEIERSSDLVSALREHMSARLAGADRSLHFDSTLNAPNIWLMVGVNGAGKTTSLGKISAQQRAAGRSVLMAAGDTFRAAAGEQLAMWAERSGADIVRGSEGGDPSSVIFDAVQRAESRKIDLVLADTAGRLQSNVNLMEELRKVRRVAEKGAGKVTEVLLVIDATTGQNGLSQAKQFADATQVTGVVLTKMDGSAKGGIVFAIETELGIPVKMVGLGETIDDLVAFDPEEFVAALFD